MLGAAIAGTVAASYGLWIAMGVSGTVTLTAVGAAGWHRLTTKQKLRVMENAMEELEKQRNELVLTKDNMDTFAEKIRKQHDNYLGLVTFMTQKIDVVKPKKFQVAFVGPTSAGKTSTINYIYGTKLETSCVSNTVGYQVVWEDDYMKVLDVHGCSDSETYFNLNQLMKHRELHMAVVVYTDSFDHVTYLSKYLNALNLDVLFSRNKSERLTENEIVKAKKIDYEGLEKHMSEGKFLGVIISSTVSGLGMKKIMNKISQNARCNRRSNDDEKKAD